MKERDVKGVEKKLPAGILIHSVGGAAPKPRIAAFIWGGKVPTEPTLPFGRWKPTPA